MKYDLCMTIYKRHDYNPWHALLSSDKWAKAHETQNCILFNDVRHRSSSL